MTKPAYKYFSYVDGSSTTKLSRDQIAWAIRNARKLGHCVAGRNGRIRIEAPHCSYAFERQAPAVRVHVREAMVGETRRFRRSLDECEPFTRGSNAVIINGMPDPRPTYSQADLGLFVAAMIGIAVMGLCGYLPPVFGVISAVLLTTGGLYFGLRRFVRFYGGGRA